MLNLQEEKAKQHTLPVGFSGEQKNPALDVALSPALALLKVQLLPDLIQLFACNGVIFVIGMVVKALQNLEASSCILDMWSELEVRATLQSSDLPAFPTMPFLRKVGEADKILELEVRSSHGGWRGQG